MRASSAVFLFFCLALGFRLRFPATLGELTWLHCLAAKPTNLLKLHRFQGSEDGLVLQGDDPGVLLDGLGLVSTATCGQVDAL